MAFKLNIFTGTLDIDTKLSDNYIDSKWLKLDQTTPQTMAGLSDGFLSLTSGVIGTGTVDLSGYVPYTGATGAVNLGANNLTVDTNVLFVDATNDRVGIGTSAPSEKLDVIGDIEVSADIHNFADNGKHFFGAGDDASITYDATDWVFKSDVVGTGAFLISSNNKTVSYSVKGNLAVHTDTAQAADVGGLITLGGQVTDANAATRVFGAIKGGKSTATSGTTSGYLAFYTNKLNTLAERMRIDADGNVGIGTTAPLAKLDISGSSPMLTVRNDSNNAGTVALQLLNTTGNTQNKVAIASAAVGSWGRGNLHFVVDTAADVGNWALTDSKMMIDGTTGNVGIGTTAPSTTLDINSATSATLGNLRVRDSSAMAKDVGGKIAFTGNYKADGSSLSSWAMIGGLKEDATEGSYLGYLSFQTRPAAGLTERMRITSAGNVGIGTNAPKSTNSGLDIASGGLSLVLGADGSATTRTNATTKTARIAVPHYTNTEEPAAVYNLNSTETANIIGLGGGSALMNAATLLQFYTAANNTTTTGTVRMNIQSDGEIRIPVDFVSGAAGALSFGAGQDAEMGYNGTNFIINPKVVGSGFLNILGNVVIGNGAAGVDYTLTFDGETNDGVITWQEDEDNFDLSCGLSLNGGTSVTAILDQDDMASDSATALATQQSIKAYVDAQAGGSSPWTDAGTSLYPTSAEAILVGGTTVVNSAGGGGGVDDNTKLYVKFDGVDEATTAPDETGNHTLTFVGTAKLDDAQTVYAGDGTSLLLDGNSDYITIPDSADWDICASNADDWTIDFWYRHAVTTSSHTEFINHNVDTSHGWNLLHSGGNGLYFVVYNGAAIISTGFGGEITDSNWHHIALCKVADKYAIYKNGTQINWTQDSDTYSATSILRIGTRSDGAGYVNGNMAHIRIQNSNIFNASPNVGLTDTISVPTEPYGSGATPVNVNAIGTTATLSTNHSLDSKADLLIEGDLEVQSEIYLDDNKAVKLGADSELSIKYSGSASVVILPDLPTADPHVVGQLWANSSVLTVSAG